MLSLKRSIAVRRKLAGLLGAVLLLTVGSAHAEIVSLDVTIKSVDADERLITVTRSSKTRSKDLDLEVSKKAKILIDGEEATLDDIAPGQSATVSFESELEIVTRIEVSVDGDGDEPPRTNRPRKKRPRNDMPDEVLELRDTGCQVIWTIDENGESTVTIGRPAAFTEPASETLIQHEDDTVEFQHDLNTSDSALKALMSRAENTRFDRTLGTFIMAPKAGRGGQSPQANFAYAKVARLPISVVYEFEGVGEGNSCLLSAQLRSADETDFPALHLFSEDGFATTATVRPTWIVRRDNRGQPGTKPLLDEQVVEIGEPQQISFQMPVPDADTPYVLEFGLQGEDVPTAMRRLFVRGRLTPTLGVALLQAGGSVVAERVLPKGLGESAGVKTGDVIVSINGIKPRTVQEAMEAMGGIRFGDEAEIVVRRGGRMIPMSFLAE